MGHVCSTEVRTRVVRDRRDDGKGTACSLQIFRYECGCCCPALRRRSPRMLQSFKSVGTWFQQKIDSVRKAEQQRRFHRRAREAGLTRDAHCRIAFEAAVPIKAKVLEAATTAFAAGSGGSGGGGGADASSATPARRRRRRPDRVSQSSDEEDPVQTVRNSGAKLGEEEQEYVFREFQFDFPLRKVVSTLDRFNAYAASFGSADDPEGSYTDAVRTFCAMMRARSREEEREDLRRFVVWREWGCHPDLHAHASDPDETNFFLFSPRFGRAGVHVLLLGQPGTEFEGLALPVLVEFGDFQALVVRTADFDVAARYPHTRVHLVIPRVAFRKLKLGERWVDRSLCVVRLCRRRRVICVALVGVPACGFVLCCCLCRNVAATCSRDSFPQSHPRASSAARTVSG